MEYLQHLLMRSLWVVLVVMLAVENGCNGCLEKERIALLQLKDSINFPNRMAPLPSWQEDANMDCCQWEHVECNSTTHRVIKLELYNARDYREDDYWHLNASILLPFESLRSLNLSANQLLSFVGNEGMNYFQHLLMISLWVGVIMLAVLENGCNGCLEKERIALLQLKHSINFPYYPWLPSWEEDDSMDCCHWERVECNSTTRRVIKLELNNTRGSRSEDWHLNVSILLPFESLRSLGLSENRLRGFVQNEGIGILAELINLEELDLSWNSLGNGILPSLNKLSNLKILNLAFNNLNGSISAEVVIMLAELENGCNGCLEKDSINFPNGTSLPSWEEDDNMDCCHWECVECYSTTHRVIKHKLNRTIGYWSIEWHLNASILLPFESLQSLNLSQNQLQSFVGNEGMASDIFYMIK
ncbi:hypothetical protein RHMOL_Rhmol01G0045200 [Rhododendron molle]|uniref:Uncharacterized protein n=1 Tax=Rhododendron molle TaxID=49168 RepID=A0ACC0PZH7_RHOML|nr:hypothetical protein RHMOL_Rhmol01G0045200 [Rhododendron molle]